MSKPLTCKQLLTHISSIQQAIQELSDLNARGVFNDKEQKKQQLLNKKVGDLKQQLAEQLSGSPCGNPTSISPGRRKGSQAVVQPTDDDDAAALGDFFEQIILETDNKPGNLALARAMLHQVSLDYPSITEARGLLAACAVDGSMGYLECFLSEPQGLVMRFDTEELLCSAFYNQQFRIPLVALLLRHEKQLALDTCADTVTPAWQEFVADIASKKKVISREDRSGQRQLVERMLTHPIVKVDPCAEGGDGMTIFSRACLEGESWLVELMIKHNCYPLINRINGDGMTALMNAVVSNCTPLVKMLVTSIPSLDLNIEGQHGSAVALAASLKRDPAMVQLLKDRAGGGPTLSVPPSLLVSEGSADKPLSTPLVPLGPRGSIASGNSPPSAPPVVPVPTKRAKQLPTLSGKPTRVVPVVSKAAPPAPAPKKARLQSLHDAPRTASEPPLQAKMAAGRGGAQRLPGILTPPRVRSPQAPPSPSASGRNPRGDNLLAPPASLVGSHSTPTKALRPVSGAPLFSELDPASDSRRALDDFDLISPKSTSKTCAVLQTTTSATISSLVQRKSAKKLTPSGALNQSNEDDIAKTSSEDTMSLYSLNSSPRNASPHRVAASSHGELTLSVVMDYVSKINALKHEHRRRASNGVFTEEEFATQESYCNDSNDLKASLAHALRQGSGVGSKIAVPVGSDEEEMLGAFFAACVLDSDAQCDNADVVLSLLECVDFDVVHACNDNDLIEACAADGSVRFLEPLMRLQGVRYDLQEVCACCFFNQQYRIPLVRVLFRCLTKSQLQTIRKTMWEDYNEFFVDVCSQKKAIPGEDRSERMQLIETMITHPILTLDPMSVAGDGLTVLSRAAHEGDTQLLSCFVRHRFTHHPNWVLSDGTTALVHAVYGNSAEAVALLLTISSDIDVNFNAPKSGSAFAVASNLRREKKMLTLLESHGGDAALGSSKVFCVPELPPLESKRLEASMSVRNGGPIRQQTNAEDDLWN